MNRSLTTAVGLALDSRRPSDLGDRSRRGNGRRCSTAQALDGWRVLGDANWELADRAVSANSGGGFLVSDESYGDFELTTRVLGGRACEQRCIHSLCRSSRASMELETAMRSISTIPGPIRRTEPEGSCTWRHRASRHQRRGSVEYLSRSRLGDLGSSSS